MYTHTMFSLPKFNFCFFKTRPNPTIACSIEKPGYFLYFSVSRLGPSEPSLGPEIGSSHVIFFYLTSVRPKKPISGGPSRMNERNFIAEFRNRVNVLGPWENMDPGHMNVLPTSHFSSTQRACQGRKGRFRRHSVRFWESILEPKRWKI